MKFRRLIAYFFLAFIFITSGWVLTYRYINPPYSTLMVCRFFEKNYPTSCYNLRQSWTPFNQISPQLKLAVLIGEDFFFYHHKGYNIDILKQALINSLKGFPLSATSTITQQLAKNLFLTPHKTYLRKALELYFSFLLEFFLSKDRIFELYLNTIEWGRGIFGIKKASEYFFSQRPCEFYFNQACLLVGAMPFAKHIDKPLNQIQKVSYRAQMIYQSGFEQALNLDPKKMKKVHGSSFFKKLPRPS
jgi:monofunctional biosynthetic peptidoglycan transglycosylase